MGGESPVVELYDSSGNPLSVQNGVAIPANTPALMFAGSDGTNSRYITVDSSGRQVLVGAGVAGTPAGGVVSIQGVASGTNLPVSQATAANLNALVAQGAGSGAAATYWYNRITDGTNTMPTGDVLARAIFHQITDATNGPVAVKAASTTPVATDKALVVTVSPNSAPISVSPIVTTVAGAIYGHRWGFSAGAGTPQPLRATIYTEQTTGAQRSLKSSSANDTSAGTGARTVTITYYDASLNGPNTETITLNGTTAVNTVNTNIAYIEQIVVTTVGSNLSNVGTISLFTTTAGGGSAFASIGTGNRVAGVGDNRTFWAHHYVRPSTTLYISGMSTSFTGVTNGETYGSFIALLTANAAEIAITPAMGARQAFGDYPYRVSIPIVGPGRFTLYNSITGGNEVDGSFEFLEQ